jgi:hypothetical protein
MDSLLIRISPNENNSRVSSGCAWLDPTSCQIINPATRIKDAIINHLVMCAFSLGDTLAMDMYVIILIIYFYYSGLSKTAKNDKKS